MNELHASLFEGSFTEIQAFENSTVDGYYGFLLANNARCEKIKKKMEEARNKT